MDPITWILGGAAALAATTAGAIAAGSKKTLKQKSVDEGRARAIADSYRHILQRANDAMFLIDTVNGRIFETNDQAAEMLGMDHEKLKKSSIFELHPPELLLKSSERIADAWEQGGMIYDDLPLQRADGSLIPVECSARVMEFNGRPAILIYARDITERLRMQGEILKQNEIISQKNADLTDSIVYARRIQEAILPDVAWIRENLPGARVFYRPKDIVSGDFYFFNRVETPQGTWAILGAADCTGHGVPGALMSVMGSNILNDLVNRERLHSPELILNQLNTRLKRALKQDLNNQDSTKDGMDIALAAINTTTHQVAYAGAMRPLLRWHPSAENPGQYELEEIRADRMPIGGGTTTTDGGYTVHTWQAQPGERLYMYTDGITDQFGGPEGRKKFTGGRFKKLLEDMATQDIDAQMAQIQQEFEDWKGTTPQTDDVMVIAVSF